VSFIEAFEEAEKVRDALGRCVIMKELNKELVIDLYKIFDLMNEFTFKNIKKVFVLPDESDIKDKDHLYKISNSMMYFFSDSLISKFRDKDFD
jgi:hypothetical protein